jgi:proteasome lid subunit RPN8/RPN11
MTKLDVADLEQESLLAERFPAELRSAFRLHMAPAVHRGTMAHAKEDDSVEICGVLVGRWGKDEHGPFALVTDYIRCDNAASKLAEVTFTHESWAAINREMDTRYADKRIVGWYHSHPDFGIFLSDRDAFIHEHFFNGPGQVAYVVDPVRNLEGAFSWRQGKPAPMAYFWVGDEIRTVDASQRSVANLDGASQVGEMNRVSVGQETAAQAAPAAGGWFDNAMFPAARTLLAWMCLFLLGYGCAEWRVRTEQRMVLENAFSQLLRLGLNEDLSKVRENLRTIHTELAKLPPTGAQVSPEEAKAANDRRRMLSDGLMVTEKTLGALQQKVLMPREERPPQPAPDTTKGKAPSEPRSTTETPTKSEPPASPNPVEQAGKANESTAPSNVPDAKGDKQGPVENSKSPDQK